MSGLGNIFWDETIAFYLELQNLNHVADFMYVLELLKNNPIVWISTGI